MPIQELRNGEWYIDGKPEAEYNASQSDGSAPQELIDAIANLMYETRNLVDVIHEMAEVMKECVDLCRPPHHTH